MDERDLTPEIPAVPGEPIGEPSTSPVEGLVDRALTTGLRAAEAIKNRLISPLFPDGPEPNDDGEFSLPERPLRRNHAVRFLGYLGMSWSEAVERLNLLREDSPHLFTPPGVIPVKCEPEAIARIAVEWRGQEPNDDELPTPAGPIRLPGSDGGNGERNGPVDPAVKKAIAEFDKLSEKLKNPETSEDSIEAEKFANLISWFGKESTRDILYAFHPEAKGGKVPIERVNGFISDYLGNCLKPSIKLDYSKIGEALPFIGNPKLETSLREVIKRDVLRHYNAEKSKKPGEDAFDLIADYLDDMRSNIKELDDERLTAVSDGVLDYYMEVIDLERPDNIVESLGSGRAFPDLNQKINIYETMQKKRMLIGDEPGMGKSASAIIAKEKIGAKCAVILAPSDVLKQKEGGWREYLSSRVYKGEQKGYFKPDEEPRVLIVNKPSQLKRAKAGDWDYILMSHESVNPANAAELKRLGADMLIIDEAHYFKNLTDGKRAPLLLEFARDFQAEDKYLMLLTATPAPNKVRDIVMILRLLFPEDEFKHPDGRLATDADLVTSLIEGDALDIRSKLLPYMQLKLLEDLGETEPAKQVLHAVHLSRSEREIHEVIREELELLPGEKQQLLRRVLMNPNGLAPLPSVEHAKFQAVSKQLVRTFKTKTKVAMFMNDLVDDTIRGLSGVSQAFLDELEALLPGVNVKVIHGDTKDRDRLAYHKAFQEDEEPMLIILSGQTVSHGTDYSAAQELFFWNEPWTMPLKIQQQGRADRPGRTGQLVVHTFFYLDTIEAGIHEYIKAKYRIIQNLLYGIPITQVEKELLRDSESGQEITADISPELARHYLGASDRLDRMFGEVKEKGEQWFKKFLEVNGKDYAESYRKIASRSYQANCSRLAGTLISLMEAQKGLRPLKILDVGSGPEMLLRHIPDHLVKAVTSIDINPEHFVNAKGPCAVAPMADMPVDDNSIDYVNMTLAFHYTKWAPRRKDEVDSHDRLKTLIEVNRVLKTGGRAVITMPYGLDIGNPTIFRQAINKLGFKVIESVSGTVTSKPNFKAHVITLEKTDRKLQDLEHLSKSMTRKDLEFRVVDGSPHDTRRFATEYTLRNKGISWQTPPELNAADLAILQEERDILEAMITLRSSTPDKRIRQIPPAQILARGFSRINWQGRYVLFKYLTGNEGAVVLRDGFQRLRDLE